MKCWLRIILDNLEKRWGREIFIKIFLLRQGEVVKYDRFGQRLGVAAAHRLEEQSVEFILG